MEEKLYKLMGEDGKEYLSKEKGTMGGHKKLKIYGRLDCWSANNAIKKGQYVKYRVFFKDEETAIKAGYRPCAKCMPKEYKKWKQLEFK
ncbi:Metal binding domain of Ada [Clostridium sp. DSM 8431]|uniref:Ada metal-binding domain-containing protein n=1 Tax=Clostridium sp. DSM 8431 TaxID=1761781 RepID=UPI0008E03DEF|nr:Ada metal-binding domain-containing protein [Clostridium sp. DSM 8431]SFU36122.1 Metal binding domain of Ada [Clostridium sp. DSM 8431]